MRIAYWVAAPGVTALLVAAAASLAPSAAADCVSSAGTTICSQGEVRGSNTGRGPQGPDSSGPWMPYGCYDDWYCDSFNGWGIDIGF